MIRVLLADDHKIVRDGLRQLLSLTKDIRISCELEHGDKVIECLETCGCTLAVVDLSMPEGGNLLIAKIRSLKPDMPILVLTMHNEPEVAANALQAGANGFVTKDCDAETLIFAIRTVSKGGRFIDPKLSSTALSRVINGSPSRPLSEREVQVLSELAKGRSINEIAALLGISAKTVSTHKANLMQKLNADSTAALIRYAILHNLG